MAGKIGRPKKSEVIIKESSMTDIEKARMRFSCLSLVVNCGSRLDSKSPVEKAEEYYSFVVGKSFNKENNEINETIEKEKKVKEQKSETAKDKEIEPEITPFGDSGRKKVLLS